MPYVGMHWPYTSSMSGAEVEGLLTLTGFLASGTAMAALAISPHFVLIRTMGHFDQIDTECQELIGLTDAEIYHYDHHYPATQKEVVRKAIARAVRRQKPIRLFYWQRGRQQETLVAEEDEAIILTLKQSVRAARASHMPSWLVDDVKATNKTILAIG